MPILFAAGPSGEHAKPALTAGMRKPLVILNAMLRSKTYWQTPVPATSSSTVSPLAGALRTVVLVPDGAKGTSVAIFFLTGQGHDRLEPRNVELKHVVVFQGMVTAADFDEGRNADNVLACRT